MAREKKMNCDEERRERNGNCAKKIYTKNTTIHVNTPYDSHIHTPTYILNHISKSINVLEI